MVDVSYKSLINTWNMTGTEKGFCELIVDTPLLAGSISEVEYA
jgi:hypothetical protein